MIPKSRKPTTPGEILDEEFLKPMGLTQKQLTQHVDCDIKVINRIINGRTSVAAEMAVKLGAALNTTPEFWLNAQQAVSSGGFHRRKTVNSMATFSFKKNRSGLK